jgi:hypothetical protein
MPSSALPAALLALLLAGCTASEAATVPDGPLVVVGRLAAMDAHAPHCGFLHVAVAVPYEVVHVEHGRYHGDTIVVIHGCPEMSRRMYGGDQAGDLDAFRVGDRHRLTLSTTIPDGVGVVTEDGRAPAGSYWATRTDRAAAP